MRGWSREQRLQVATAVNVAVVAAQFAAGLAAGSLALLADAGHNLTDTAALLLALVAVRLARRAPTPGRTYGYHRATVLAAQANAAMILAVTLLLGWFAIARLISTPAVDALPVVIVAGVATALDALAVYVLNEPGGGDLNTRAALLHMGGDALVSLGVTITGVVMLLTSGHYWLDPAVGLVVGALIGLIALTGWTPIDPLLSLAIAGLIAFGAWRILSEALAVLMEAAPREIDMPEMVRQMLRVPGVRDVHDLHVWSLSDEMHALSAHVVLEGEPSLATATAIGTQIKQMLADDYAIAHATLELEADVCATPEAQQTPLTGQG